MAELKPCPFCGGEAKLEQDTECVGHGEYHKVLFVQCKTCYACGSKANNYFIRGEDMEAYAVGAWNRRERGEDNDLNGTD